MNDHAGWYWEGDKCLCVLCYSDDPSSSCVNDHEKGCPFWNDWHQCNCQFNYGKYRHRPYECEYFKENKKFCPDCSTKWYNCAHCEAGYPDQECTCKKKSM